MKANRKRLKTVLALAVRNIGLISIASKLIEFPLFNDFFPDLAKFQDLDVFMLFNFPDLDNFLNFLVYSTLPPTPNSLTSPLLIFSHSGINLFSSTVVFSIEVNEVAILLKS